MTVIKAIQNLWEKLFVTYSNETEPKVYLKRGPLEKLLACKPNYVGEIVLCTDHPSIYVWTGKRWEDIPIGTDARFGFLGHYGDRLSGDWLI